MYKDLYTIQKKNWIFVKIINLDGDLYDHLENI